MPGVRQTSTGVVITSTGAVLTQVGHTPPDKSTVDVIEDYEGDLSAYTDIENDTSPPGTYVIVNESPLEGSGELHDDHAGNVQPIISSPGDGLDKYPDYPCKFRAYCRSDTASGGIRTFFGWGDAKNTGYEVQMGFTNDVIRIRYWDDYANGTSTGTFVDTNEPYETGKWYYGECVWDDGTFGNNAGDIVWTVYRVEDDFEMATMSINDTQYVDQNGCGASIWDNDGTKEGFHDYYHVYEGNVLTGPFATWVDNFDDQDLAEYTGQTGSYGFVTSGTIQGTATLQRQNTSGGYERMVSTSGLDNYVSKGTKFQYKTRAQATDTDSGATQIGGIFGAIDTSNYYAARYEYIDDQFLLQKRDAGNNTALAYTSRGSTINGYTKGNVLVVELVWDDGTLGGANDDITATLYNADKSTQYAQISANDSTFATETGVGVSSYLDTAGQEPDFDAYEVLS